MRARSSLVFGALVVQALACAHSDPNDGMLKEYPPLQAGSSEDAAARARPAPEPGAAWRAEGEAAPVPTAAEDRGAERGSGTDPAVASPAAPAARSTSTPQLATGHPERGARPDVRQTAEVPPDEDWLAGEVASDDGEGSDPGAGTSAAVVPPSPAAATAAQPAPLSPSASAAAVEPATASAPPASSTSASSPASSATSAAVAPAPQPEPSAPAGGSDAAALLSVRTIGGKRCVVELCGESLGAPPVEEREVPTGKHNVVVRCGRSVSELYPVVLRPGVAEEVVVDMRKKKSKGKSGKKKKGGHLAHR